MGLFTLCDLIKKNTHAECVSELAYGYKRTVSCESTRLDHMKKGHI